MHWTRSGCGLSRQMAGRTQHAGHFTKAILATACYREITGEVNSDETVVNELLPAASH